MLTSTIDSHFNRIYRPRPLYRGRQLVTWSLKNGFDEMGNWKGEYLFDGITGLPWD